MNTKYILLSFDLEEFDIPLEYGQQIDLQEQLRVSQEGMNRLLPVLNRFDIKATFFTTAHYAQSNILQIKSLSEVHEIASHANTHTVFSKEDYSKSKIILESIIHKQIYGFRMPRLAPVDIELIKEAGYSYDSSIHPTWIPGRYNHRHLSESIYKDSGLLRIPCSVSPSPIRFPLFWLSFKNFPLVFYQYWLNKTLTKHGTACLYFHPWEYADIGEYKLPYLVKAKSGQRLIDKLSKLIEHYHNQGVKFISIKEYLDLKNIS